MTTDVQPLRAESFNHLHLNVRDLNRSVRFYEKAFGLRIDFKAGPDLVFMAPPAGGFSLALHGVGENDPVGMAGGAGGALVSRAKHDGKYPYTYVSDPDGYVIEL